MDTFNDLYSQIRVQKGKMALLRMLIETLDGDFLQSLDGKPKKILLTDEKLAVDTDTVDLVIQDLLVLVQKVEKAVQDIQSQNLKVVIEVPTENIYGEGPPPAPAPPQVTPQS